MSSLTCSSWDVFCSLLYYRVLVARLLLSIFGYLFPALSSAKAIVTKDEDGLREWLIWLTLPRYQGAYKIYTYALRSYFEQHEAAIDKKINEVTDEVRQRAQRQFQNIMWQIFMSPNDGLLPTSASMLSLSLGALRLPSMTSFGATSSTASLSSADSNAALSSQSQPRGHSGDLRVVIQNKKLLSDFRQLLEEGMYIRVAVALTEGESEGVCESRGDGSARSLTMARVTLRGEALLDITPVPSDDSSPAPTTIPTVHVPLLRLMSVQPTEDPLLVCLALTPLPLSRPSPPPPPPPLGGQDLDPTTTAAPTEEAPSSHQPLPPTGEGHEGEQGEEGGAASVSVSVKEQSVSISMSMRSGRGVSEVYLSVEDGEQAETLVTGFQVVTMSARGRVHRRLQTLVALLTTALLTDRLHGAFQRWKRVCGCECGLGEMGRGGPRTRRTAQLSPLPPPPLHSIAF